MHADHDHGLPARPIEWSNESRAHQRVDREARRTAHEGHRERRGQAGLGVFDGAGGEEAGNRAREAGKQRHETLAVEPAPTEQTIHDERRARHVAAVLQDADEQEKDEDLRQEGEEGPDPADHAIRDQALDHRQAGEGGRHHRLEPIDAAGDPLHREFGQPENRGEHPQHDARENDGPEDAVQQDPIDGGTATRPVAAALHDPFQQSAEALVVDQRFRGQWVVTGAANLVAGGADDGLAARRVPAEALSDRSRGIKKEPLHVGPARRAADIGGHAGRHIRQSFFDQGGPFHRRHPHARPEGFADGATNRGDAFAFPGGGEHDGNAPQTPRQEVGVDLHALLGGHIGLVQHEHDGQVQLGELGGEEEVAEEVRRVDDHDHGIGAAVIGKVTGERVDDDLLIG